MGIDYEGVGGIGIKLTKEIVKAAIKNDLFTQEDWDECEYDCLEKFGMNFSLAGNSFSGNEEWYLFVPGDTLRAINNNAPRFVFKLQEVVPGLNVGDLRVISEMLIS